MWGSHRTGGDRSTMGTGARPRLVSSRASPARSIGRRLSTLSARRVRQNRPTKKAEFAFSEATPEGIEGAFPLPDGVALMLSARVRWLCVKAPRAVTQALAPSLPSVRDPS
jgi:hypothetical protein